MIGGIHEPRVLQGNSNLCQECKVQLKRVFGILSTVLFTFVLGGLLFVTSIAFAAEPPAKPPSKGSGTVEAVQAVSSNVRVPFPSYGSGPIEVSVYTNYFCAACRAMEPVVEPILKELLKNNMIRLILVDIPFDERTNLFARNFLYAIRENNDLEHALRVRDILIEASTDDNITTQKHIEAIFKKKGIPFSVFDVEPIFERYIALIKDGNVKRTPTCVIVKEDQKRRRFSGGPQIVDALNALK
jgi:thiol-disulfide isomerase/thioredoxin